MARKTTKLTQIIQVELSQKEVQDLRYLSERMQEANKLVGLYSDFAAYAQNTLNTLAEEYAKQHGLPIGVDYELTDDGILKVKSNEPA